MIQALLLMGPGYIVTWEADGNRAKESAPVIALAVVAVGGSPLNPQQVGQALAPMVLHDGAFRLVPGGIVSRA